MAAPVRFRVAESDADQEIAFRLRYQAIVERGWAQPEEMPDGREQDAFDPGAVHIVGWAGDTPVGVARVVLPDPSRRLPTEASFDLTVEPHGQVVDAGRFVVVRAYSQAEHRIFAGLVAECWRESRRRGFVHVCGAAPRPMLRLYRRVGLQVETLGPARLHWGEERYPWRLDLQGSAEALRQRWPHVAGPG